jgi:hypothetical protein
VFFRSFSPPFQSVKIKKIIVEKNPTVSPKPASGAVWAGGGLVW